MLGRTQPGDSGLGQAATRSTRPGRAIGHTREFRADFVEQFIGKTVRQAFLSVTNYHRWHSPVAGTIVRAILQDGKYYPDAEDADAVEPQNPQSYPTHVATQAIILIQADNPVIGLTTFVPVCMSEVSSSRMIGPHVTRLPHRQGRRTRLPPVRDTQQRDPQVPLVRGRSGRRSQTPRHNPDG
jgi:hypothetical protein